jgi:hypothetical protein
LALAIWLAVFSVRSVLKLIGKNFGLEKWTAVVPAFDRLIGLLIMVACATNNSTCSPRSASRRNVLWRRTWNSVPRLRLWTIKR